MRPEELDALTGRIASMEAGHWFGSPCSSEEFSRLLATARLAGEGARDREYAPGPLRMAFVRGVVVGATRLTNGELTTREDAMTAAKLAYPDTPVTEPRLVQSDSRAQAAGASPAFACPVCNQSWALHDYDSGDHCPPPSLPSRPVSPTDDDISLLKNFIEAESSQPIKDVAIIDALIAAARRDSLDPSPGDRVRVPRCKVTGNVCGTDTWGNGHECGCAPCQDWLRSLNPTAPDGEDVETFLRAFYDGNDEDGALAWEDWRGGDVHRDFLRAQARKGLAAVAASRTASTGLGASSADPAQISTTTNGATDEHGNPSDFAGSAVHVDASAGVRRVHSPDRVESDYAGNDAGSGSVAAAGLGSDRAERCGDRAPADSLPGSVNPSDDELRVAVSDYLATGDLASIRCAFVRTPAGLQDRTGSSE